MSNVKEDFYDEHISPLMATIIELCKQHQINFAAQFSLGYEPERDQTLFCTTVLHDVDPADKTGVERMRKLRAVMFPPSELVAFTITTITP